MEMQQRKEWHDLPDVYVRLHKDELGYPPKDWEQLKAEPTDREDVYKLNSIPFYARGLAYLDEVRVITSSEGFSPVVESVARRSGYSTVRLWLKDEDDRDAIINYAFGALG